MGSFIPPNLFLSPMEVDPPGIPVGSRESITIAVGLPVPPIDNPQLLLGIDLPDEDTRMQDGHTSQHEASPSRKPANPKNVDQEQTTRTSGVPICPPLGLALAVRSMYQILKLINETGSNGYVEKIIIAQESLQRFINAMSPGAYSSITKVDFKTLDRLMIKPLGVYGSKTEIARLLVSIGAVDEAAARLLVAPANVSQSQLTLQSGIYVVVADPLTPGGERHYIIYWPEDLTWSDSAPSSVRRNRITFMRYLTKICDQVVALLSPEHSASIVWNEDGSDTESIDMDPGDSDRLFTFVVSKTHEQEESAVTRSGFQIHSPHISTSDPVTDDHGTDVEIPKPRLLSGETTQGFLTATYVQRTILSEPLDRRTYNHLGLLQLVTDNALVLSEDLDENAIGALMNVSLAKAFPNQHRKWRSEGQRIEDKFKREHDERQEAVLQDLERSLASLQDTIRVNFAENVANLFPSLDPGSLRSGSTPESLDRDQRVHASTQLAQLEQLYPDFTNIYRKSSEQAKFGTIKAHDYQFLKERLIFAHHLLQKHPGLRAEQQAELIEALLSEGDLKYAKQVLPKSKDKKSQTVWSRAFKIVFSGPDDDEEESFKNEMKDVATHIRDSDFLTGLKDEDHQGLQPAIHEVEALAHSYLSSLIESTAHKTAHSVLRMQQNHCRIMLQRETEAGKGKALKEALLQLIRELNEEFASQSKPLLYLNHLDVGSGKYSYGGRQEYKVTGRREAPQDPKLRFRVHPMHLSSDDKHSMQLDVTHVPSPTVNDHLSSEFHLPVGVAIVFSRLLENEKLLLVLLDRDTYSMYLERLPTLDAALQHVKPIKTLHRDKLGHDSVLFAFDEVKRMLAVCASHKLQLHLFVFDEDFKSLRGQGSAIDLSRWYGQASTHIIHSAFICGGEEIFLVDSTAQVRIFSFITMQFRPASLQLRSLPRSIYSSPDGSCLLVLQYENSTASLTAYHCETFGSNAGIELDVVDFPLEGATLTSMGTRLRIFLLGLDVSEKLVKSVAVNITKRVTEFMFKERGGRNHQASDTQNTRHNSLLDCHVDVWTRFPVIPAVRRGTITSSSARVQKSLSFVTDDHAKPFDTYFSELIQNFEKATRKPTGDELRCLEVTSAPFSAFESQVIQLHDWNVSHFRVGEWLVDLLCLIPIQIAVCRENRFVPFADGVSSSELERSLLGAEVNAIVDKLSFGWYESIFQSYLALKPVKVVSSMGQQSVGKSFALNHLVDTSFAGSAMRTTEGVWMSVTPTDEVLIVALDFEGVDSVERSPQEDTLLVLFNTAISNLVLFRNNFAFSRDISGLFQSFQSSASVLDPAANPTLFQSTLAIIIKDVVDADKREITREFSLKFQKIVQEEQDANFISRLHGGKLDIIPWPVIESKEFYKLFATLKRRLDLQKISHPTAGEFLHTIKTLMAKLKANDWGALSQTMAEHRAKTLASLLSIALATGYAEIEPVNEPLKNFDTDIILDSPDSPARFAIPDRNHVVDVEAHLAALRESWNPDAARQSIPDSEWTSQLKTFIDHLVDLRINHVRFWLSTNLERFQAGHAAIEDLHRNFESMVIEMKTNVQFCGAQCASCHLVCLRGRLHEGEHDCQSDHKCAYNCVFCGADELKSCNTSAGHPGRHICSVSDHLCGEPCKLLGKRGCLEECTKVLDHDEEEHLCSALVHMCGKPCDLQGIKLQGGKTFSCQESCSIPSDEDHDVHSCNTRLCPATCELCKRLCDQPHLHGLKPKEHHLCGEAHPCPSLCSAPGTCHIDTTPQSIEATFTGRHETFQYTKYTQVARRLRCGEAIPPGKTSHPGAHMHKIENKKPFHHCEARCENCGYFCTLPLGHAQQEHETSHGSMTQTRWAVHGPDGTSLELDGRKFSSNDEGAPMMCNLVCSSMGRHVHISYCRADEKKNCKDSEVQHLSQQMIPNPNKPKDFITHNLYWRRTGFKDPYTRDEQANFTKCDAMCSGPEHAANNGQPSFCTLPMFHPPCNPNDPVTGLGYVSNDGHMFDCRNPIVMQQAFHVIFVIDRSGSMSSTDRRPLDNAPAANLIRLYSNNRLGAVYSALYSFWSARQVAVATSQQVAATRRDAYSVVLFDHEISHGVTNNFTSSPDQLLRAVLMHQARGGTNFAAALRAGQTVMSSHWSTERTPIMIFLSDGECSVPDESIQDVCRSAIQLGKPLSFHSVSFGPDTSSSSLRRMTQLALETQNNAPRDPLMPATANVPSSFSVALDTVRLAETFLGIAESLRKPRGSLLH